MTCPSDNRSVRIYLCEVIIFSYKVPVFHKNFFEIRSSGLKVVTNGKTLLDYDLVSECTSVKIFSTTSRRKPRTKSQARNSNCRNSKVSLAYFVLSKRKDSLLIKPFVTLRGWHKEKSVFWKFSVGLNWVLTSKILLSVSHGPLKTAISKKTILSMRFHGECDGGVKGISEFSKMIDLFFKYCRHWK